MSLTANGFSKPVSCIDTQQIPVCPKVKTFLPCRLTFILFLVGLSSSLSASESVDLLPVTAATIQRIVIYPTRTAPANVVSINNTRISAEVSAVIEEIPVQAGQIVEPGTPLVKLRQTDISLAIDEAEATLKSLQAQSRQAKDQLQRVRSLVDKQAVTQELLSERETEAKVSAAALVVQRIRIAKLRQELKKTVARAPFKAIVVERIAHVGELAMEGTPLVRVMDATRLEVVAELPPDDVPSLLRAEERFLLTRHDKFPLRLLRVIPVIDEREWSQEIRLRFEEKSALIGTSGHVAWREASPHLPADLLVRREGILGVFTVVDDVARFIETPNAEEGRPARSTLPADSMLILDGRFVVQDGQAVKIKPRNGS